MRKPDICFYAVHYSDTEEAYDWRKVQYKVYYKRCNLIWGAVNTATPTAPESHVI